MGSTRWIWLGSSVALLLVAAGAVEAWALSVPPLHYCAQGLLVVCIPIGLGALTDWWMQVRGQNADLLYSRQKALSMTAMGVLLEAAKGVHPAVLESLMQDRARRWGLISGTRSHDKSPYSVLLARPRVTDRFAVHVLRMSNQKGMMAKRLLSDGDKSYDPAGIVTAYEMYDDLESLWTQEFKITRPYGTTRPAFWLAGWDPESVALDMGLDLEALSPVGDALGQEDGGSPSVVDEALRDLIPLR